MNRIFVIAMLPRQRITSVALLIAAAILVDPPSVIGAAAVAAPAGADGTCTIEISIQTAPAFSERLSCRDANFPDYQSLALMWESPRGNGGRTVNLTTGKRTADYARLRLDARLPATTSDGREVLFPVANHLYTLNSSSQSYWSGIVEVFPNPTDMSPIECKGGSGDAAVAETSFRATWSEVTQNANVVHGLGEALLNCTKINLKGPNVPLGVIGRLVVKF